MKVAIIHDSLVEFGGAERVLMALLELYPNIDLYTAYVNKHIVERVVGSFRRVRIHTVLSERSIFARHGWLFQSVAPSIWRRFDLGSYDLVFSCPSYLMCNLVNAKGVPHIQYIQNIPKNLVGFLPKTIFERLVPYTTIARAWYKYALLSTPSVLANSKFVKRTLQDKFQVRSSVVYPPVSFVASPPRRRVRKYYLCVTRLDEGKYLDLAIRTCTQYSLPLVVVGKTNNPSYEKRLRSLSGPTVRFFGEKSLNEIQQLHQGAIAFIHTAKNEDFGIAPVEAMGSGVPVVAYYGGALKETVIPDKTGVFFYTFSPEALAHAIRRATSIHFNRSQMRIMVDKFNKNRFQQEIHQYIQHCLFGV